MNTPYRTKEVTSVESLVTVNYIILLYIYKPNLYLASKRLHKEDIPLYFVYLFW